MKIRTGSCVVLGAFAILAGGCGGGGHKGSSGHGGSGGSGGAGGTVSDDVRFSTLDKMESAVDAALKAGTTDAQLAQRFRTLPGIVASGTSDTGSVYAEFADGRVVFVSELQRGDSGDMDEGASDDAPATISRGIPNSRSAYVFDTIGPNEENPVSSISGSLTAGGYTMQSASPYRNASVDALKTVNNAAVFFISTHGGSVDVVSPSTLGKTTFALTSTKPSPANDAKYRADLNDSSLNYVLVRRLDDGTTRRKVARRYCFSRNFVRKYMTFAPHAVAAIDSCSSYVYGDMAEAFREKGATYLGWSNRIATDQSEASFSYFFDRLVGANAVDPAEPEAPQRPFGYAEIFRAMGQKSLASYDNVDDHDPTKHFTTNLLMTENVEDGLDLSIKTMEVDEDLNELHLEGEFSDEPGTVQMNGHNLTIKQWDANGVTCDLPISGPDSSGDVQAFYQGRASNVETLTEWNGALDYVYKDAGTLKQTVHSAIRFRADAARLRQKASQNLQDASHAFRITNDMTGTFEASGTYADDTTSTTWSGSAQLTAPPPFHDGPGTRIYGGVSGGKIWWKYDFLAIGANHVTTSDHGKVQTSDADAGGPYGQLGDAEDNKIEVPLTSSLVFPGGERSATFDANEGPGKATTTLKWTDFVPTHLPHPGAPR